MKIAKIIHIVFSAIMSAMVAAVVIVIAAGVFWRYVLRSSLPYTFELSTLLYAYIIFCGISLSLEDGSLIGVDIVTSGLSKSVQDIIRLFGYGFMIVLGVIMTYYGVKLVSATHSQLTVLRIPMKVLYASMPAGLGYFTFRLFCQLVKEGKYLLKKDKRGN